MRGQLRKFGKESTKFMLFKSQTSTNNKTIDSCTEPNSVSNFVY